MQKHWTRAGATPEGQKADKIAIKKETLAALEERKVKECGE